MRALLWVGVALCGGCAYWPVESTGDRDPFEGTVKREGETVPVTLWRVWQEEPLEGNPSAAGWIQTQDGPVLTHVEIVLERFSLGAEDSPDEIPVTLREEIGGNDYGASVSWVEQDRDGEQVFRHVYQEGPPDPEVEGTLTIEDTDWTTFLDGRVVARVANADFGEREIELAFSWGGLEP